MGPEKIIQITQKFGLRGEKCIGFGQFYQKFCTDYAEFTLLQIIGKCIRPRVY